MPLEPDVLRIAQARNFGALTVLLPSGYPMTNVMWVDADDDHILINTEVHRAKFKAVEKDPRVTLAIWDAANPYSFAEVRGRVARTTRGPEARGHIDTLCQKYHGEDYPEANITSERVILHISPEIQHVR